MHLQAYNSSHHGRVPRLILPGTFTVDVRVVVTDRYMTRIDKYSIEYT